MDIINKIEDAIGYIIDNKETIIAGAIVAIALGIVLALVMLPCFI
jgi:hypothetical protein